jgi:RNA polymerase sigma-70 factor (ECF subfamily)
LAIVKKTGFFFVVSPHWGDNAINHYHLRNKTDSRIVIIGNNVKKSSGVSGSSSEGQLIQQAQAGNADAFARLYDAYVDEIYRFIFYRVSNQQTAEDLTSQLFLKTWDNLDRYQARRGASFKAWLMQIARNLVIDHYRTFKETTPLEPIMTVEPDPTMNVVKEVERRLQGEWLQTKLQELTDEQREVVTLKFIHGFSTKEIARMMNKKEGAIRALQMRGLQALANIFESDDVRMEND